MCPRGRSRRRMLFASASHCCSSATAGRARCGFTFRPFPSRASARRISSSCPRRTPVRDGRMTNLRLRTFAESWPPPAPSTSNQGPSLRAARLPASYADRFARQTPHSRVLSLACRRYCRFASRETGGRDERIADCRSDEERTTRLFIDLVRRLRRLAHAPSHAAALRGWGKKRELTTAPVSARPAHDDPRSA